MEVWFLNTNWNSTNSSKITLYGSFYKVNAKNESIEGSQVSNQENDVLDTGIKIENSHVLNSLFTFKNGYQFNEIGIRNTDEVNSPQIIRKIKDVLRNHALITEMHYLSKNNTLEGAFGIRQNYISQFKKYLFEPRIQLNYELSSYLSTQFLGEFKHQTNTQIIDLQQDFLGIEKKKMDTGER
ncbi:MAG: hypothetical protein HC854_05870 [Flavobacterium sp.]|nr:hypothetical protein [Flavobacterium sp.]